MIGFILICVILDRLDSHTEERTFHFNTYEDARNRQSTFEENFAGDHPSCEIQEYVEQDKNDTSNAEPKETE